VASNKNLIKANRNKNDEFYTQLTDIEKELKNYKDEFKGKIILCNCDDPYESNFFKYFAMNFNYLGLKKIITTCYASSPIVNEQLSLFDVKGLIIKKEEENKPYKIEITEVNDENCDGATDLFDVEYLIKNKKNTLTLLEGNGDFRSPECIELLKEADIVVTNPPFSLFRDYIAQLFEHNKKFLIIGNQNSITCKEIFPLIKNNEMWLGYNSGGQTFRVPNDFEQKNTFLGEDNKKYAKFGNICWCTNLDVKKRHEKLIMYKNYKVDTYPKYVNYDAINVDKVKDIPYDYYGVMGVPITFITSYNPDQFKIIGISCRDSIKISEVVEKDAIYQKGGPQVYLMTAKKTYKRLYNRLFIVRIDKEEEKSGD